MEITPDEIHFMKRTLEARKEWIEDNLDEFEKIRRVWNTGRERLEKIISINKYTLIFSNDLTNGNNKVKIKTKDNLLAFNFNTKEGFSLQKQYGGQGKMKGNGSPWFIMPRAIKDLNLRKRKYTPIKIIQNGETWWVVETIQEKFAKNTLGEENETN